MSAPWRYEDAGRRDLRFDLLRGYALFAMTVDHLDTGPSWFYAVSGRAEFYTSAAEGFYFISGVVLGIISARRELGEATRSIMRRAWQLYLTVLGISLGFAAYGALTQAAMWGRPPDEWSSESAAHFVAAVMLLRETFHDAQIIALYVVTMLAVPLAVWACHAGRGWLVLIVSAVVYLGGVFFRELTELPFAVEFHPATWQTMFFGGLVLGFHKDRVRAWVAAVPRPVRIAVVSALFGAGLFFMWVHATEYAVMPELPERLGERGHLLSLLRLAFIALYFAVFFLIVHLLWRPLRRALGWFLLPLGQNSLWTFTVHLALLDVAMNVPVFRGTDSIWLGTFWHVVILSILWATVKLRGGRGPEFRRRRMWVAASLVAAFVLVVTPFAGGERHEGREREEWWEEYHERGWRRWTAHADMEPEEAEERLADPHGEFIYGADGVHLEAFDDPEGSRFELVIHGEFMGMHPLGPPDKDGIRRAEHEVRGRLLRVEILRGRWATIDLLPTHSD
ncbi:hypothetical protein CMK11_11935 [Candidatus Poribacteria bacterium]|nr:hypothetical protein [Candidatus Poribacteria bacterium]